MGIQLYKHNMDAYQAALRVLNEEGKTCVVHPTGTGKSYIAFKLIEDHPFHKFVWLGPSDYIYQVQADKLRRKQGVVLENVEFHTYAWLMRNEDEIAGMNPDYIVLDEFHRAGAKCWGRNVRKLMEQYPAAKIFGMTATNIRYLDKRRDMADELFEGRVCSEFDIVEAMVRGYLPVPTYVVCAYYYQDKFEEYEERISKKNNPAVQEENRKILERLRRAIEQAEGMDKIFAKYIKKRGGRYIVFCTSLEKMYEMMTRIPEWFAEIDRLPHVYCVHSYNIEADADFRSFQEDDSEHIKLLFTIDMLNEGIHVDGVDGVILLRPTISPIVYKQQIGRALASDAEERPIIFDMVNNFDSLYSIRELEQEFIQMKESIAASGEYVTYEDFKIIDELQDSRALFAELIKNLESSWEMCFRELANYKAVYGTVKLPKKYKTADGLNLGKWLLRQRCMYREGKLEEEKANHLTALGVDFRTDKEIRFAEWLELLKEYKEEHGHLLIPNDYVTKEGKRLGVFVFNTRARYWKGKLYADYIERLEKIGFEWSTMDVLWERNYKIAESYYKEHGHLDVAKRYKTEDGINLGMWLATQRNVYLGRVPGDLTAEQKEKLDMIGMVWNKEPAADIFERRLAALRKYVYEHGDALVPKDYVMADGFTLGQWVNNLRTKYTQRKLERLLPEGAECLKSYITVKQEEQLIAAGMVWRVTDTLWDEMYEVAKQYFEEHGHLLSIPYELKGPRGQSLCAWVSSQLEEYRGGKKRRRLSAEQIKKLEAIGIDWERKTDRYFERGLQALIEYKKSNESMLIPVDYQSSDGYNLGKWVARQRKLKRENKLQPEREKCLTELGFTWDYTEYHWNMMYDKAKAYYEKHGNLAVPTDYVCEDGAKLWQWKMDMRKRYRNNGEEGRYISDVQIKKLEAIGMVWDGRVDAFAECMKHVREYKKSHGVAVIPKNYVTEDGVELGKQFRYIMHRKNMGTLSAEQLEEFERECDGLYIDIKNDWWKNYEEVRRFYEEHGNTNIPQGTVGRLGIRLDSWVNNQSRLVRQGKVARYDKEQLKSLGEIGISVDMKTHSQKSFENGVMWAKNYLQEHGHLNPPRDYRTPDGRCLFEWIRCQKRRYRAGRLSEYKLTILQGLGIMWNDNNQK